MTYLETKKEQWMRDRALFLQNAHVKESDLIKTKKNGYTQFYFYYDNPKGDSKVVIYLPDELATFRGYRTFLKR